MPRLFVQHVAVIGASLAFAFCRPASALDISVPHVSVPHIEVPRPQINVPRSPQIYVPPHRTLSHMNFYDPSRSGRYGNEHAYTNIPPASSVLQGPTGMANTPVGGPGQSGSPPSGLPAGSSSVATFGGSSAGYSGASAGSSSFGCGRTPARSCR
jgi:hypothetical protein